MRPGPRSRILTRRALGGWLASLAAAAGLRPAAAEAAVQAPLPGESVLGDPGLREAALRGVARRLGCADPLAAAEARATLGRLAGTDPEAACLVRIYRAFDAPSATVWQADGAGVATDTLALLHAAIRDCRPVAFGYTDLAGARTHRRVRPLALAYPPQGMKLLAWCETRQASRQFFVRAISGPQVFTGGFRSGRRALLEQLAAEAGPEPNWS